MISNPFAQAEQRQLTASRQATPGTLHIGQRTLKCGLRPRRGLHLQFGEGGQQQRLEITALVAIADLPRAEVLTDTGATRSITFTHVETGLSYRLSPTAGSIEPSPHGIYWTLRGTQAQA